MFNPILEIVVQAWPYDTYIWTSPYPTGTSGCVGVILRVRSHIQIGFNSRSTVKLSLKNLFYRESDCCICLPEHFDSKFLHIN